MKLFDKSPVIAETVFVAPSAAVIGDVKIGQNSSIWYGCVIRGQKQL
jgi:carbonic anhydrase/acetyltransferase-like protein (isoleucine patch superfamily)